MPIKRAFCYFLMSGGVQSHSTILASKIVFMTFDTYIIFYTTN